jgi:ABC-type nickel/cobalt efflux system permease component RcnA
MTPPLRNPLRAFLDLHPPWAHGSFAVVWAVTASVGPILFGVALIDGSSAWWIGLSIYGVALLTMAGDWLVVRRLRSRVPGWQPWKPPRWAGGVP